MTLEIKKVRVLKKTKRRKLGVLLAVILVVLVLLFSLVYFVPSSVTAQDDYTFGTETVNKGISSNPTEKHTENGVYNQLQEADQYTDTNFSGSSENVVTGTAGGDAFPGALDADDSSRRSYAEGSTGGSTEEFILRPTSDGSPVTFVNYPTSPTTNFDKVDETTAGGDGDTTYNEGTTNAQEDTYVMGDISDPGAGYTFDVRMWIIHDDEGAVSAMTMGLDVGGTNYAGWSGDGTSGVYENATYDWLVDPSDSQEWTVADINALGTYLLVTDANPDVRVTQVALIIYQNQSASYTLDAQITYSSVTSTAQTTGYKVFCQGYRNGDTETIKVQAWNYITVGWDDKVTVSAGSDTDNDFDLTAQQRDGAANEVKLRLVDGSGGDAGQTVVYFDVLKVSRIEVGYSLDVELTATGVTEYGNITLRIKGYTSAEQFNVNVYNYTAVGYDLNQMAITDLSNTWQTTLNLNETNHRSGTNVKIQFLDETSYTADTTLDSLYLDVAWVTRYHTDPNSTIFGADPTETLEGNPINFFLNYTDYDNEAPSANYPKVHIDDTNYTMAKNDSGDNSFWNGCNYSYQKSDLPQGEHTYYFIIKDASSGDIETGVGGVTMIHTNPTLTGEGVNPSTGNNGETFSFYVVYDDIDDDLPTYMKVHIDSTDYDMDKNDTEDVDPPIAYYYAKQMSGGSHTYYFKTIDEFSTEITTTPTGLEVNNIPVLSSYGRAPGDPVYPTTLLNFTATYTDADNDLPSAIKWRENEGSVQNLSMAQVEYWDEDVTDGKLYYLELYLSHGNHDYDYWATDGTGAVSGGDNSITIQNRNPTITNKIVDDHEWRNTYWEYDYAYEELDGDSVTFEMATNASFLNINSASGLVYGTTSDPVGWYDVQVWCNDSYEGTDTDLFVLYVDNRAPIISNGPGSHVDEWRNTAWFYDFDANDADTDSITWEKSGPAWLSIVSGTGYLSGTTSDTPGLYTFTVYANDSYGGSDDYTFDIHIENRAPVITNGPGASVNEWRNTAWDYDFDYSDDDGDSISWGREGADWLGINSNGLLSGTTTDVPGDYGITVYCNDSYSGQDTYLFTLHIINRLPTITSAGNTTQQVDTFMAYNVTATDADLDYLTCEFWSNASWLSLDSPGWWVNGTATGVGWYQCRIWVNDSYDSDLEEWIVTVTAGGNQPPSYTSSPKDAVDHPVDYYYDCNATDPEEVPLTFGLETSCGYLGINPSTGEVTGNIPIAGTWDLNISVTDGTWVVWQNFSLVASNTPPAFDTTPTESWQHGTSYSYDANAHDDNGDSYSFGLAGNCTAFLDIISGTGVVSGIVPTVGWWYLNVSVSDSNSTTWQYHILTGLNTAPSFSSSEITEWQNGTEYVYDANADDINFDSLVWYLEGNGTVYFSIDPVTGEVSGTILQMGWWYCNISASDSWSTVWQNFTATALNTAPSFSTSPSLTLVIGLPYYYNADCTDINGDTLYFELIDSPPAWAFVGWTSGEVEGTPTLTGNYDLHLRAFDGLSYAWQNWTLVVSEEEEEPTEPPTPPVNPSGSPSAKFSYLIRGDKIAVTDESDGDIARRQWTFGDGFGGVGSYVIHEYAEPGKYIVTLKVWDKDGHEDTAVAVITISEGPSYGIERGESGFVVTIAGNAIELNAVVCVFLGLVAIIVAFGAKTLPINPKYLKLLGGALLVLGLAFYLV